MSPTDSVAPAAELWQRWLDSDVMSAPIAVDGELYVTSFAGTVYKFKQADGTVLSAERSRATSAPVVMGKNVYLTQRADNAKDGKAQEHEGAGSRQVTLAADGSSARSGAMLDTPRDRCRWAKFRISALGTL